MDETGDIRAGRLPAEDLGRNFLDAHPPLHGRAALVEASRCHFCWDAPCVKACPTSIDIPSFIRKIATDNMKGAATDILSANIMGGMCARVCPTEILCEQACVRHDQDDKPVEIGLLQRHATEWVYGSDTTPATQLFRRAAPSGRRVAVVGGGPAGLSCAHRLAMLGHDVTVFEAREKAGGLNEYGIAAYKTVDDFAAREVAWILSIGGIEVKTGQMLGRDISLDQLRAEYDAVFLGLGLGAVRALGAEGETLAGVEPAVDFIARLRQADDLSTLPVGRQVVVIGGGNTAVDAAVQSKKLGAEDVTMVYRRGTEQMSATPVEQDFARSNGVVLRTWMRPVKVHGANGRVTGVEFAYTRAGDDGRAVDTGETRLIAADQVLLAIGQVLLPDGFGGAAVLEMTGDRIAVDAGFATSLAGVWAGGDCVASGIDLTVQAVEHGKQAALSIDAAFAAAQGRAA
ncbi:NAD(P)-dependent oxidoreductase [Tistrella mobilis]|uniref:dihydrouracil dehydrogenase (NAD(+)) n=1 Tax=Tistrella mobilis (strain KA081020-065) TaxID=1110502 RepID=I3TW50_TISMK|nr:NAD(P)-dependent oxidoreductase [Tistrella mobilis]AFK56988.1 putative oxidoreductase [Tistrella mobilis KA081020-065]